MICCAKTKLMLSLAALPHPPPPCFLHRILPLNVIGNRIQTDVMATMNDDVQTKKLLGMAPKEMVSANN